MKGVVVGKFYPPHRGHHYLIDAAIENCTHTDVLVVDNPTYHISAERRQAWIAARHPQATVHIVPDIEDDDNSDAWAKHTIDFLGYPPDVVFSSEAYGKTWAEAMGCDHVDVDIPRSTVPISGTLVREDILEAWQFLDDEVRAGLAIRIVVLGAESTGTTTLTRDLAEALHAPWVPEMGRYYTESILTSGKAWTNEDFYRIGKMQQMYENEIAKVSDGVIICDTNAVATELWQRRYMERTTTEMSEIAMRDKADLYIITGDEIPFVQDGLRDGKHVRHKMHEWFIKHIEKTGVPFIMVSGTKRTRLALALKASRKIIASKRRIPHPYENVVN
jgi:HTH-type transcriptional repressor of NAD biosynthesis genes